MRIVIPGKPKYQKRHRHGRGRTWNPSSQDKAQIRLMAQSQCPAIVDNGLPLSMSLIAYYPFPKSWSKKDKAIGEGAPKTTKPDIDNVVKLYADALNGVAYHDDNQVVEIHSRKLYSAEPCVVIDVELYDV